MKASAISYIPKIGFFNYNVLRLCVSCILYTPENRDILTRVNGRYRSRLTYDPGFQHHHHHEPGMPFDFNYAVKEDAFGNDYSHNAISDGEIVRGEYRVQLPDGRTQLVRYTADWQHGFSAQVSYDGTPRFDIARPGGNFNRGY